jgi:hypothetical protein
MEELNKELFQHSATMIVNLEYLGIHIDKIKEEENPGSLFSKTAYYYSVPEASILETENQNLNAKIKTANDLKQLAKEVIIDMLIEQCKEDFCEDSDEFVADVKSTISDYSKFYAKVRSGEVWNKELAEQRIKELAKEIEAAVGYQEV